MDDMFPCKQIPLTEKGKDEYDRIFGHGEYSSVSKKLMKPRCDLPKTALIPKSGARIAWDELKEQESSDFDVKDYICGSFDIKEDAKRLALETGGKID